VSDQSGADGPTTGPGWGRGGSEPTIRVLAGEALMAASSAGTEYADLRVVELEEERIYAVTGRGVGWRTEHSLRLRGAGAAPQCMGLW
jgi:hypothetical protein